MLFITTKHNKRKTTVKQELDKEKLDIAHLSALGSSLWFCCFPPPPPPPLSFYIHLNIIKIIIINNKYFKIIIIRLS